VREIMAKLGFRKLKEMVGRTDKLIPWKRLSIGKPRASTSRRFCISPKWAGSRPFPPASRITVLEKSLDNTKLLDICKPAIERGEKVRAELPIINVNRVVGTIVGSEITKHTGRRAARGHGASEIQRQRRPEPRRVHAHAA
jgi:hypothetical protein